MEDAWYNEGYYETGQLSGKSLYTNYRWMPEETLVLSHNIMSFMNIKRNQTVLDFGCAKGYLVKALRMFGVDAHGVDLSSYAVSQADDDVRDYVRSIKPIREDTITELFTKRNTSLGDDIGLANARYDFIVCKDVLEHVPYNQIDTVIRALSYISPNIFVIVPLGNKLKYYIDEYEEDKSHYIREDLAWWHQKFQTLNYSDVHSTKDVQLFKEKWYNINPNGNGLLYVKGKKK